MSLILEGPPDDGGLAFRRPPLLRTLGLSAVFLALAGGALAAWHLAPLDGLGGLGGARVPALRELLLGLAGVLGGTAVAVRVANLGPRRVELDHRAREIRVTDRGGVSRIPYGRVDRAFVARRVQHVSNSSSSRSRRFFVYVVVLVLEDGAVWELATTRRAAEAASVRENLRLAFAPSVQVGDETTEPTVDAAPSRRLRVDDPSPDVQELSWPIAWQPLRRLTWVLTTGSVLVALHAIWRLSRGTDADWMVTGAVAFFGFFMALLCGTALVQLLLGPFAQQVVRVDAKGLHIERRGTVLRKAASLPWDEVGAVQLTLRTDGFPSGLLVARPDQTRAMADAVQNAEWDGDMRSPSEYAASELSAGGSFGDALALVRTGWGRQVETTGLSFGEQLRIERTLDDATLARRDPQR